MYRILKVWYQKYNFAICAETQVLYQHLHRISKNVKLYPARKTLRCIKGTEWMQIWPLFEWTVEMVKSDSSQFVDVMVSTC